MVDDGHGAPPDPERFDPVERLVARHGESFEPPPDWEARVWARIAAEPAARTSWAPRWLRWLWAPALAAGVAAAVFLALPTTRTQPAGLSLSLESGGQVTRGHAAKPGDRLVLTASTGGVSNAELRVYREGRTLVARCTSAPPCRREGDRLDATVELPSVGRYRVLFLFSDGPLPEAASSLDEDAGRARAAGAKVRLSEPIDVY